MTQISLTIYDQKHQVKKANEHLKVNLPFFKRRRKTLSRWHPKRIVTRTEIKSSALTQWTICVGHTR